MQIKTSPYKNIIDCAIKTYKTGGLNAFYVSYSTTLLLNVPFHSIQFPVYEAASKWLNAEGAYKPHVHILAGAVAGGIAGALTTPLDCVRTLLQTKEASSKAKGLLDGIRLLYASRGLGGFFRGVQPRILANMPATAICWTTYEYFKSACYSV